MYVCYVSRQGPYLTHNILTIENNNNNDSNYIEDVDWFKEPHDYISGYKYMVKIVKLPCRFVI